MSSRSRYIPTAFCGALIATASAGAAQTAPERVAEAQAVDGALLVVATPLVERAAEIDAVWPGFWGERPAFLLLRPRTSAVLITHGAPPAGYQPIDAALLPAPLHGIAYLREEYPPTLGQNSFSLRFAEGADTVPALEPGGRTLFGRIEFYLHEHFHGRQGVSFAPSRDGDRRVRLGEALAPAEETADAGFAAGAERERALLLGALAATGAARTRIVAQYLDARDARLDARPVAVAIERSMERMEGTATFVGCSAAAAALGAPPAAARGCIERELRQTLDDRRPFPEADAQLMRWRLYGTGAALAWLIDGTVDDWRERVRAGAPLDELLREGFVAGAGR